jgi:hypothetical protein
MVYAFVLSDSRKAALIAAGLFAFHPLSIEIVPAVARNIDSLMTLLVLASIWMAGKGRGGWALFFGALALGAKETALAGLPMAVGWAWMHGHKDLAKRLALGLLGLAVAYLALRHQVLQGIGGYYETETLQVHRVRQAIRLGPWELIAPGWSPFLSRMPHALRFASAVTLLLSFVVLSLRLGDKAPLSLLGLGLIVLPLVLYAITGTYTRRLLYLPTAGLCFSAVALLRHRKSSFLLALWLLSLLPASPLIHRDQDWAANDAITQAMTLNLEADYAALEPGTRVWIVDRPVRLDADPVRRRLWSKGHSLNNSVAGYSLQAWADDRLGEGHIDFKTLSFTLPRGALPTPRVALRQDGVLVRHPKVKRTKNLQPKTWERQVKGEHMLLRPRMSLQGDRLLVSGAPRSVLVALP